MLACPDFLVSSRDMRGKVVRFVETGGREVMLSAQQVVMRCVVELGVAEKLARNVLFRGWPYWTETRLRIFQWGLKHGVIAKPAAPVETPEERRERLRPNAQIDAEMALSNLDKRMQREALAECKKLERAAERERREKSKHAAKAWDETIRRLAKEGSGHDLA